MLDEIEKILELNIEKAIYYSKISVLYRTSGLFDLWKFHNDLVSQLQAIDPGFFRGLHKLNRPVGTRYKVFMKDRYYYQFLGKNVLPVLEALEEMKNSLKNYKEYVKNCQLLN